VKNQTNNHTHSLYGCSQSKNGYLFIIYVSSRCTVSDLMIQRIDSYIQRWVVPLHLLSLFHVHLHRTFLSRPDASDAEDDQEDEESNADDGNHCNSSACVSHTSTDISGFSWFLTPKQMRLFICKIKHLQKFFRAVDFPRLRHECNNVVKMFYFTRNHRLSSTWVQHAKTFCI